MATHDNQSGLKLRQKDRQSLLRILRNLERGQTFLMHEMTLVCRRKRCKTTSLDLTNDTGDICYEINREIGSELTLLHTGISELRQLIGD